MSKRIFSKEQIEVLLQNPNVAGCSDKSISYHKEFKISAVKRYHEGLSPNEIFRQAEFDLDVIGRDVADDCLVRWRRIFKNKGESGLKIDGRTRSNPRGRPKDLANLTDKDRLKYLDAQVAYLKAENAFLAKLRKQRLN